MKDTTIEDLEGKINQVKQTIENVKSLNNLRKGSRVKNSNYIPYEYIVVYVRSSYHLINLMDGNRWSDRVNTLDEIRYELSKSPLDTFTIVGDPNINDLHKQLKDLSKQLQEASKPKVISIPSAPDGWYVIEGRSYGKDSFMSDDIQKGDVIFIKNGIVFMKDHGRFKHDNDQYDYCIKGIPKSSWYYTVTKLP